MSFLFLCFVLIGFSFFEFRLLQSMGQKRGFYQIVLDSITIDCSNILLRGILCSIKDIEMISFSLVLIFHLFNHDKLLFSKVLLCL